MVEKVASHFNHSLSVVVNNNAILSPESGGSANIDDDSKFRAIMGDNVMAAVRFSQLSVPYLAKASASSATGGSVINVNGPQITVNPGAAHAHKLGQGAMDELTRTLAIDLVIYLKKICMNVVTCFRIFAVVGSFKIHLDFKSS